MQILLSLAAAAPAGFNPYLAAILVGMGSRAGWIILTEPFGFLGSNLALGILVALLTLDIYMDKGAVLGSVNDTIGHVMRPVAGAIIFAGTNTVLTNDYLAVSLIIGAVAAGLVHLFKRASRKTWMLSSSGLVYPAISAGEDLITVVVVLLAMFAPVAALILLLFVLAGMSLLLAWVRRGKQQRAAR